MVSLKKEKWTYIILVGLLIASMMLLRFYFKCDSNVIGLAFMPAVMSLIQFAQTVSKRQGIGTKLLIVGVSIVVSLLFWADWTLCSFIYPVLSGLAALLAYYLIEKYGKEMQS